MSSGKFHDVSERLTVPGAQGILNDINHSASPKQTYLAGDHYPSANKLGKRIKNVQRAFYFDKRRNRLEQQVLDARFDQRLRLKAVVVDDHLKARVARRI